MLLLDCCPDRSTILRWIFRIICAVILCAALTKVFWEMWQTFYVDEVS